MTQPRAGEAWSFTISLYDVANPGRLKTTPTLTVGDFTVSVDGGALTSLTTLPTETPAGSGLVVVHLSGSEVGLSTTVRWSDPQFEWSDGAYSFPALAPGAADNTTVGTPTSSTVRDLITAALLDLGAIASGEACTAAEAADGFRALNLLLESWRLESLMVYAISTVSLSLTGAASYTWGAGGTIASARPVHLDHAVQRQGSGASALDFPLQVFTAEEYERIGLKAMTSSLAAGVYLDHAYPLASLFPWPIPPSGDTLVLFPWTPLTAFASLDTTVALPPGYERALQAALAIDLAPSYRDCTITPALAAKAVEAKALLKAANAHPRLLTLPAGLPLGQGRGRSGTSLAAFLAGGNV